MKVCQVETMAIEQCTKPHVVTVVTRAKFHLSLQKADLSIAEIVIETIEDINSIFSKF